MFDSDSSSNTSFETGTWWFRLNSSRTYSTCLQKPVCARRNRTTSCLGVCLENDLVSHVQRAHQLQHGNFLKNYKQACIAGGKGDIISPPKQWEVGGITIEENKQKNIVSNAVERSRSLHHPSSCSPAAPPDPFKRAKRIETQRRPTRAHQTRVAKIFLSISWHQPPLKRIAH